MIESVGPIIVSLALVGSPADRALPTIEAATDITYFAPATLPSATAWAVEGEQMVGVDTGLNMSLYAWESQTPSVDAPPVGGVAIPPLDDCLSDDDAVEAGSLDDLVILNARAKEYLEAAKLRELVVEVMAEVGAHFDEFAEVEAYGDDAGIHCVIVSTLAADENEKRLAAFDESFWFEASKRADRMVKVHLRVP